MIPQDFYLPVSPTSHLHLFCPPYFCSPPFILYHYRLSHPSTIYILSSPFSNTLFYLELIPSLLQYHWFSDHIRIMNPAIISLSTRIGSSLIRFHGPLLESFLPRHSRLLCSSLALSYSLGSSIPTPLKVVREKQTARMTCPHLVTPVSLWCWSSRLPRSLSQFTPPLHDE